jgi:hypothetical protein
LLCHFLRGVYAAGNPVIIKSQIRQIVIDYLSADYADFRRFFFWLKIITATTQPHPSFSIQIYLL